MGEGEPEASQHRKDPTRKLFPLFFSFFLLPYFLQLLFSLEVLLLACELRNAAFWLFYLHALHSDRILRTFPTGKKHQKIWRKLCTCAALGCFYFATSFPPRKYRFLFFPSPVVSVALPKQYFTGSEGLRSRAIFPNLYNCKERLQFSAPPPQKKKIEKKKRLTITLAPSFFL